MPEGWPHGVALAVFLPVGIQGDHIEHPVTDGPEQFDIGMAGKALRILPSRKIGGGPQIPQLREEAVVNE